MVKVALVFILVHIYLTRWIEKISLNPLEIVGPSGAIHLPSLVLHHNTCYTQKTNINFSGTRSLVPLDMNDKSIHVFKGHLTSKLKALTKAYFGKYLKKPFIWTILKIFLKYVINLCFIPRKNVKTSLNQTTTSGRTTKTINMRSGQKRLTILVKSLQQNHSW